MGGGVSKAVFGIFAILGWLVLMGLHVVWHYTFGWIFRTLAALLDVGIPTGVFGTVHPLRRVSKWLSSLDRNVDGALVASANDLEHSVVWLFSRLEHLVGRIGKRFVALALTMEHALWKVIRVTVPRLVNKLVGGIWHELRNVGRFAHKLIPLILRQLNAARHAIVKAVKWELRQLFKFFKSLTHTVRGIWRNISSLWKLYRKLHKWLNGKGFRNLVRAAMGKLGAGYVFTTNVGSVGKWLGRIPVGDVYEWVKDAVIFAGSLDVCKVAQYNFDVAVHVIEPMMRELIGFSDFFCRSENLHLASGMAAKPGYDGDWEPSATPPVPAIRQEARLAPGVPLPKGVIKA